MINPQDLRITNYPLEPSGGMTVGLTTSGIIVHHIPTGVGVSCDSERSQYANKEKALSILERLVIQQHSLCPEVPALDTLDGWERLPTPYVASRVMMIVEVRQALGCGLREAKDLVDKYYHREDCKQLCIEEYNGGKCVLGDACVCGGDLPQIREGCFNWSKV